MPGNRSSKSFNPVETDAADRLYVSHFKFFAVARHGGARGGTFALTTPDAGLTGQA
jgi:hypothetical protein